MASLRIMGGRVIDPTNGVDAARDLWIADGKVVAELDGPAERTIDARGFVVMPGGVDVHCHIAGPKVTTARVLRPEDKDGTISRRGEFRSGTTGAVPSSFATGYQYAGLGYTTAIDAAVPFLGARHAHLELADTPIIDKAFLVLVGSNHYVMDRIREGDRDRLQGFIAWVLSTSRAYGMKVTNPGGVEKWKQGHGNAAMLDERIGGFGVTPRQILVELAHAGDALGLPHALHVHGLNLGLPGNAMTTLETLRALDGHRAHLAHIQFHSYDGDPTEPTSIASGVEALADYVNTHDHVTVDVGQILFGETTGTTADAAVGQYLHAITGRKWVAHDLELEGGCGIVPITYQPTKLFHALQWAIGLEWFLRVTDPWRIALSTDHPNGGSFLAYPQIIAWLMNRTLRDEVLARLPAKVREKTRLAELDREYTLAEIAIVTRANPARILGLANKGHLGPGADADVTIYTPDDDKRRMFALPRWVVKSGMIVVEDGELRASSFGRTLHVAPSYDEAIVPDIRTWFESAASIRFANLAVN